jgi:pSer/pThr/pTyr-binding forkhead associated (FHA) protein
MEIEQRIGLYQVFLKLYEHHRGLLDEILQLENTSNKSLAGVSPRYVQGVVQERQVYLVTNLLNGKSQMLLQPQRVWAIGRDRGLAMRMQDRKLSRRHAAIQYIENDGFYFYDLSSTNGSYINGEPVHQRQLLKDGDRIRLGSVVFSFFFCGQTQPLNEVPPDLLAQLNTIAAAPQGTTAEDMISISSIDWDVLPNDNPDDTSAFLKGDLSSSDPLAPPLSPKLNNPQQGEILDRFYQRQSK